MGSSTNATASGRISTTACAGSTASSTSAFPSSPATSARTSTCGARLADLERDIADQIDRHDVGKLITTVDGIGPQTAARIIAAAGDPAQFKSAAAFAAFVGVVPSLRQSGKRTAARAGIGIGIGPFGHARLRSAPWMPVLGVVRRSDWLRPFYERLRTAGKPAEPALIAALRKLLCAIYSVAKKPEVLHSRDDRACGSKNPRSTSRYLTQRLHHPLGHDQTLSAYRPDSAGRDITPECLGVLMELSGFEPLASAVRLQRSTI